MSRHPAAGSQRFSAAAAEALETTAVRAWRLVGGALLAAALLPAPLAATERSDAGLYLFEITAEPAVASWPVGAELVEVDLQSRQPDQLAAQLVAQTGLDVRRISRTLRLALTERATLSAPPAESHLRSSFVADYSEPEVMTLSDALGTRFGADPSIDDLTLFTYETIPTKSYRQGFDIASRVAVSREGDCTEHAVLLTALARAQGRPARVVFGLLLIQQQHRFFAFGHAWSEIHQDDAWQIADATRPEADLAPGAVIRYLPLMALDNEGPGYSMDLMRLNMLMPTRIQQAVHIPSDSGGVQLGATENLK